MAVTMTAVVPEWLRQRALLTPERPALLCGSSRWTFNELEQRAASTAQALAGAGVRPGDRVALLGWNSAEFVQAVWGLIRLGAVLVPLNARLTAAELAWQAADCKARFLLADEACYESARTFGARDSGPQVLELGVVTPAPNSPAGPRGGRGFGLDDLHSVIYTSGTTGKPKGAMLTYGNHLWSAVGSALNLGLHADDRWLACLPLFHIGGLSILFKSAIYGIPALVHPSFDAKAVNKAIDEQAITHLSVVSTMLRHMLEERGETPYPSSLRAILLGGGPIPPDLVARCVELGMPVAPTYGLTEACSQVSTLPPAEVTSRPGAAGKPLFMTEVHVFRDNGGECEAGEAGEICVRGPTVTAGYLDRLEESRRLLEGGWLHTGDWGYRDSDGYLYILDRRDDIVISGGENVYPAEVEAVLASHPGVREAAVFGVADQEWGQTVAAAVCVRPGESLNEEQLREFCRGRLAAFKSPRTFVFLSDLPRNASGKVLRRELRSATGLQGIPTK
jgi:o-succinylbenzoate---CoA ligase